MGEFRGIYFQETEMNEPYLKPEDIKYFNINIFKSQHQLVIKPSKKFYIYDLSDSVHSIKDSDFEHDYIIAIHIDQINNLTISFIYINKDSFDITKMECTFIQQENIIFQKQYRTVEFSIELLKINAVELK